MNAAHSSCKLCPVWQQGTSQCQPRLGRTASAKAVRVNAPGEMLFALPVEGLDDQRLHEFAVLCSPMRRADRHPAAGARDRYRGVSRLWRCRFPKRPALCDLRPRSADRERATSSTAKAKAASRSARAAIRLVKLSRSLPAVLAANMTNIDSELDTFDRRRRSGRGGALSCRAQPTTLAVASEASIPLASGTAARFVVFRDMLGVDQVAIIVGKPEFYRAGSSSASFGMPDRRRLRLAALRLWRPASTRALASRKPRRRRHSVPCPGRPRHRPCEQDAGLSIAGWRARYPRRQHHAGLRGR